MPDEKGSGGLATITSLPSPKLQRMQVKKGVAHLLDSVFWVQEAKLHTVLPYVVKGLFGRRHVVVLWGVPGSGKTLAALELACAVGAGLPWHDRRTKRGVVLYVAAESSRPYIENRIVALKREWPAIAESSVAIVPLVLDLLHTKAGDVDRVIEAAGLFGIAYGDCVLIVIDTLAVTFGGGNENAPDDMGMYVANIHRIRNETGAAVLVVHHAGKDQTKGMRGHSALLGTTDTELVIEGMESEARILRTGKNRDGQAFADLFAFTIQVVELATDPDGERVTSCVIKELDALGSLRVQRERKGSRLGKHQKTVLKTLEAMGGRAHRSTLIQRLRDGGLPRNRIYDAVQGLVNSGMLCAHNDSIPPEISLP